MAATDTTPPGPVTNLTSQSTAPTSVTLTWTNPTAPDYLGVRICRNQGAVAPTYPCGGATLGKPATTYTDTYGIAPNTQYTYALFTFDQALNISPKAQTTVTTLAVTPPAGPANVTGLTATALSDTSIKLDWTNPADATFAGVRICRNYGTTAPTLPCAGVNISKPLSTYTDSTGLIPNTQYTYSVFAYNTSAAAASGAHVTVSTLPTPATPPGNVTGLTATPLSATSIKLQWTNPADSDFAGVRICRNYGTTVPTLPCAGINVTSPNTTFTDTGLIPSTQYTYAVFAYDTGANAASGASATATTQAVSPAAPANVTGLIATPLSATSVKLDWINPADANFAGVRICRTYGTAPATLPCAGVNITKPLTTFTDNYSLIPGTQYTYTVFAYSTTADAASGVSTTTTTPTL